MNVSPQNYYKMVEQELKDIWRNSSQMERIKFDLSRLIVDLNNKATQLNNVIRKRDRREIIASVIASMLFIYLAYSVPFVIARVGCLVAIASFGYLVYRLRHNRQLKKPIDLTLSFKDQLARQRQNMEQEAKLLNTVLYWYILPPFVAQIIFLFGIGDPSTIGWDSPLMEYLPLTMADKLRFLGFVALFNLFIVWLNKRAVRKEIKPIIEEIDRLQQQLEKED